MTSPSATPQISDLAGAFEMFVQASSALEKQHAALNQKVDALTADLVEAHERLKVLLDALPAGVVLVEGGLVTHFNSAATQLLPELKTQEPWLLPAQWESGEGPNEYHVGAQSQRHTYQVQQIDTGSRSVVQIQDITANLRQVEESERVERLASMGKMSSAIAHQIRTPLATALLYASHLCNAALEDQDRTEFAQRLQSQLIHLEKLATQMLQFVQVRPRQPSWVALDDVVAEACEAVAALSAQREVKLSVDFQGQAQEVSVERSAMVSALVAIVENALQISKAGQTVFVHTRVEPMRAVITVQDQGPGIAPEMLDSLFEPFATNRISGTGLGLAIARNAIRSHRGDITAWNVEPAGACFQVSLPCAAEL